MKVLVTGISGRLARNVARILVKQGHTVLGIDRRPWPDAPKSVQVFRADTRKRPAEDVFRTQRPEAVIHMATVTHWGASREERYRINLGGTRSVFDHCNKYGVKQAIFVGRHTVYGAAPDTPLYRTEEDPPMAVSTFPDLADLVAADLYAGSALWRFPDIQTAVLRVVLRGEAARRGVDGNLNRCRQFRLSTQEAARRRGENWTSDEIANSVSISMFYRVSDVTHIETVERLSLLTFISNFGGLLGTFLTIYA